MLPHGQGAGLGLVEVTVGRRSGEGEEGLELGVERERPGMLEVHGAAALIEPPVGTAAVRGVRPAHDLPYLRLLRALDAADEIEGVADEERSGIAEDRAILLGLDRQRGQHRGGEAQLDRAFERGRAAGGTEGIVLDDEQHARSDADEARHAAAVAEAAAVGHEIERADAAAEAGVIEELPTEGRGGEFEQEHALLRIPVKGDEAVAPPERCGARRERHALGRRGGVARVPGRGQALGPRQQEASDHAQSRAACRHRRLGLGARWGANVSAGSMPRDARPQSWADARDCQIRVVAQRLSAVYRLQPKAERQICPACGAVGWAMVECRP